MTWLHRCILVCFKSLACGSYWPPRCCCCYLPHRCNPRPHPRWQRRLPPLHYFPPGLGDGYPSRPWPDWIWLSPGGGAPPTNNSDRQFIVGEVSLELYLGRKLDGKNLLGSQVLHWNGCAAMHVFVFVLVGSIYHLSDRACILCMYVCKGWVQTKTSYVRQPTWIWSESTRMHPAMARSPCRWSLDVENTVNTLAQSKHTHSTYTYNNHTITKEK